MARLKALVLQGLITALIILPSAQATAQEADPTTDRMKVTQASPPSTRSSPMTSSRSNASGFTCGGKRVCADMSSCAEARFHLEQCGMSRLDRDRDGIPCETICR